MQIHTTIGEFVKGGEVPVLAASAMVDEALTAMKAMHSSCVLVTEDKLLVGIFTERNFLKRVAACRLQTSSTALRDVMSVNLDALQVDDCISYAVNLMGVHGRRNVPIVDAEGHAVGNLSVYNVTSHLAAIFSEIDDVDDAHSEWTDIGGG